MKKFTIWLASGHTFMDWMDGNPNLKRENKGSIEAMDLNDAFRLSQGGLNPDWKERSCSVSDVIECEGKFHLVMGIGFQEISKPHPDYRP